MKGCIVSPTSYESRYFFAHYQGIFKIGGFGGLRALAVFQREKMDLAFIKKNAVLSFGTTGFYFCRNK